MKIEVNIEKKYFFGLILLGLIIVGVVGVFAYNSAGIGGAPAAFGHSVDEIDWSKTISGNMGASGNVSASGFCIGTDCRTSWPSILVSKIIAGNGLSVSPATGTGEVTITNTGLSQWISGTNKIRYPNQVIIGPDVATNAALEVNGDARVILNLTVYGGLTLEGDRPVYKVVAVGCKSDVGTLTLESMCTTIKYDYARGYFLNCDGGAGMSPADCPNVLVGKYLRYG